MDAVNAAMRDVLKAHQANAPDNIAQDLTLKDIIPSDEGDSIQEYQDQVREVRVDPPHMSYALR